MPARSWPSPARAATKERNKQHKTHRRADDGPRPVQPSKKGGTGLERPVSHENCPSAARSGNASFRSSVSTFEEPDVRTTLLFTMSANRRHSPLGNAANLLDIRQAFSDGVPGVARARRQPCFAPRAPQGRLRINSRAKPGGARRDRTDDLLLAKQALSQLSYGPVGRCSCPELVGLDRLERSTSPLSGVRSNHLSYRP